MSQFHNLINGEKPVLVDFSAEWCGPCKMMSPILQELANMMGEKVSIVKIDIDKNPDAASHYEVQSVPTLMIFKKGKVEWRQSGVMPASNLASLLNEYIA